MVKDFNVGLFVLLLLYFIKGISCWSLTFIICGGS